METEKQSRNWVAVAAIVIMLFMAFYLIPRTDTVSDDMGPVSSSTVVTTDALETDPGSVSISADAGQGYTIKQVPVEDKKLPPAPDYRSPITCASSVTTDQCAALQARRVEIVAKIDASKTDFASWVNLGSVRKGAGDYQGAIVVWNYVALLYPTNQVAYDNLADLYMNFLKDYPKAESNYLLAIKNKPDDVNAYRNLFTLYIATSYTPSASASESILKKGITANPKATELYVLLARYYRSLDRTADAKAQYAAAIESAQSQGQTTLATDIQKESDSM